MYRASHPLNTLVPYPEREDGYVESMHDSQLWCKAPTALGGKQGNVLHRSTIINGEEQAWHE
jgi:hypothetical protein